MTGGSDQDSTSARFYAVFKRAPITFSSKCFGLDCVFISNGAQPPGGVLAMLGYPRMCHFPGYTFCSKILKQDINSEENF